MQAPSLLQSCKASIRLSSNEHSGEVKATIVFCLLDSGKDLVLGLPWGAPFRLHISAEEVVLAACCLLHMPVVVHVLVRAASC